MTRTTVLWALLMMTACEGKTAAPADPPPPVAVIVDGGGAVAIDAAAAVPPPEPAPVAEGYVITAGTCDTSWLPAGYRQPTKPAQAAALRASVKTWIEDNGYIALEYRRGIVFAHSDEDRGDDGPYPSSADAEGLRVCGSAAEWLRESVRRTAQFAARNELTCDGNVCCYPGMEYAPEGLLVFHQVTRPDDNAEQWALTAWTEIYAAALSAEVVATNTAYVAGALKRLAKTTCAGEPPGFN